MFYNSTHASAVVPQNEDPQSKINFTNELCKCARQVYSDFIENVHILKH